MYYMFLLMAYRIISLQAMFQMKVTLDLSNTVIKDLYGINNELYTTYVMSIVAI